MLSRSGQNGTWSGPGAPNLKSRRRTELNRRRAGHLSRRRPGGYVIGVIRRRSEVLARAAHLFRHPARRHARLGRRRSATLAAWGRPSSRHALGAVHLGDRRPGDGGGAEALAAAGGPSDFGDPAEWQREARAERPCRSGCMILDSNLIIYAARPEYPVFAGSSPPTRRRSRPSRPLLPRLPGSIEPSTCMEERRPLLRRRGTNRRVSLSAQTSRPANRTSRLARHPTIIRG